MLDRYKELAPVVYGESAIKHFASGFIDADRLCFYMHWHDRMEINLVVSGSMMLHTDEGHFEVLPGQAVISTPRKMHGAISGKEGVTYHTIMFDVEKFCNQTSASDKYLQPILKGEVVFPGVVDDVQLKNAIEILVADGLSYHPLQAEGKVYEILGILSKYSSVSTRTMTENDKGFHAIIKYVNDHFTEKITPKDISLQFGYNETYFCRRFKEVTGLTFTKYVQALRMELAFKLLKAGKDEIRYIAWKCGYGDVSYFSNCFKSHFGFRPSEIYGMKG